MKSFIHIPKSIRQKALDKLKREPSFAQKVKREGKRLDERPRTK